jgi:hypothetical protein
VEDEMAESVEKQLDEGLEEESKSPIILRNIMIGIGGFVLAVVIIAAYAMWGFENVVKGIAIPIVLVVIVFATRKFWKLVFSSFRNVVIFLVVVSVIVLVAFLLFLGEKALEFVSIDQTLVSPIVVALLIISVAGWFIYLFNGSGENQQMIIKLVVFLSLMIFVLIAITLGGDEGSRFAFIFVITFEVVVMRMAIPSFLKVKSFRSNIRTKFSRYLVAGLYGVIFFGLVFEAVILPIFMVAQWPLSNWQIVVTCLSVPTSWYILYEAWVKYQ